MCAHFTPVMNLFWLLIICNKNKILNDEVDGYDGVDEEEIKCFFHELINRGLTIML